ncbi:pantoate--beta-alanine ligase [Mucilaginibacter gracilis]|uniref:Pantothenate synthetase n=1 Tax=Mucilaginibacter gracilis TaxID=423350 RepID=A0A495IZS1_9SPHI|nr:pantoate--beta-alanine ligase [Mucilaginibacter gracilis]RKR81608.1 pantoate--beta-alanine ligase [Mucilaginibacter gracilis]
MKIFNTKNSLQNYLSQMHAPGKKVGLVPTMGALHNGHLSLLAEARIYCDEVVCSIFVNPTQFTDPKDLEKYPRPIERDIDMLTAAGCDVLFNPAVNEMYSPGETWHLDIGPIENLLEGKYRPGHYQGVTQVVFKLFDMIKPQYAFFGQKDYQQVKVITRMVQLLNMPVKLVMCPIVREPGGLAMSSRNVHLSAQARDHSLILSQTLTLVKQQFDAGRPLDDLRQLAANQINQNQNIQLDYFEIADAETLLPALDASQNLVALVAAKIGNIRLIDNVMLN